MKKKFTLTKEQLDIYKNSKSYLAKIAIEGLLGVVGLGFTIGAAIAIPHPEAWHTGLLMGAPLTLDSINRFIKRRKVRKAIEAGEVQIIKK